MEYLVVGGPLNGQTVRVYGHTPMFVYVQGSGRLQDEIGAGSQPHYIASDGKLIWRDGRADA